MSLVKKYLLFTILLTVGLFSSVFAQPAAPTLEIPTNGAVGVSVQPTFKWDSTGSGAIQWRLQIATNNAFSPILFTSGTLTDTTYTYTGTLSGGTIYYWRVYASDGFNNSPPSTVFSFTTTIAPPTLFTPSSSSTGISIQPTFTWSKPSSSVNWKIKIATDAAFTSLVYYSGLLTDSTYTYTGTLTPGTVYYWEAAAFDASNDSSWSSSFSFTTNYLPVASNVLVNGSPLDVGVTLTGSYTYTDADGDAQGTSTFQWYRSDNNSGLNKTAIPSATGLTYALTSADLTKYITFQVTPVAATGSSPGTTVESSYYGPVAANQAPVASAVSITGAPNVGNTLTGSYTYTDAESDPQGTSTFQWYRADNNSGLNETLIAGATNSTYTLVSGDLNKYIIFRVTPVATSGTTPGAVDSSSYVGPVTTVPAATVPLLVYPADSTYRTADTLTLVWKDTSGTATSFEVLVTDDPTFYSIDIDSANIVGTSLKIAIPLNHGSPYYWTVRAKNGGGTSAYAHRAMFVVSINGVKGPQVPIPTWPINGQDIYSDTSDIRWHLTYADSSLVFDVLVSRDSTFTNFGTGTGDTTVIGATGDSFIGLNYISDSTYYWKVRARDIIHPDTSAYSPFAYFHVSKSHTHPILAWPVGGGNVYQPTQTFAWYLNGPAPGITYDFKVSLNKNLSSPDTSATGLTSRFITFSQLRSGHTYYWQVVSHVTGYVDSSAIDSLYVVPSAGPVVPVLTWPVGGSYIYTNVPTLNWFVNSTGTGLTYDIKYALDTASLGSATVYSTTNLYYTVATPLLSDTTYYWEVRSRNGTDSSAYSAPDSFKVFAGSGNPVVPVLSNPIHGNYVYTNNPTLSWYLNIASTGLTYQVRYSIYIDSLNNAPVYNTGTDSTFYTVVNALPYDSMYYWQVRSRSATDSSAFCQPDSFKVISGNGNPAVPIPSWPIGGTTVYSTPILNWYLNVPLSNLLYKVQWSTDPTFATSTVVSGIDTNNYQIPGTLTSGTTYYWNVKTYSTLTGDSSNWCPTQSFVTASSNGPIVPRIGSPQNGVLLNNNNPMLTWFLPTAGNNLSYELQYSSTPDFRNAVTVNNLAKPSTVINNLVKGQTYYWKVKSIYNNGTSSAYSTSGVFKIEGVTGVETGTTPYTFEVQQNYPNPFNPSTQIDFTIPKAGIVSVKIYNILGQLVKTLVDDQQNAGNHSVIWNGDNNFGQHVASGAYIYRVISGGNVAVKKMILLK